MQWWNLSNGITIKTNNNMATNQIFINEIQEKIVNNIISEETDKIRKFFTGSYLEHKEIKVNQESGLVSVILKFNYHGKDYNNHILPYSSFIIKGMTIIYKDQNVFVLGMEEKTIEKLNENARNYFQYLLDKI